MDPERFAEILKKSCHLDLNCPVLAGISGGPDSLVMLDLLARSGIPVYVAHINHQLRPEADAEALRVQAYCDHHHIDCVVITGDIKKYSRELRLSIEEGARNFRYARLFEQAQKANAQAVLVAHNADDQVETILMHLLRGSGNRGLRGMQMRSIQSQWSESIPLVRPLLTTTRAEIMDYCQENNLSPSLDESNQDTRYFRNRIRQELIPELQSYNPEVKERILRMSEVIQVEDEYLQLQSEAAWSECLIKDGKGFIRLNRSKLLDYHPAMIRRILWQAIHQIADTIRDVDFNAVDRAVKFIAKKSGRNHLLLLSDVELIKSFHHEMIICHTGDPLVEVWPRVMKSHLSELNLEGQNDLGSGWQMTCHKSGNTTYDFSDPMVCFLDAGKIQKARVDIFKPGDTFAPFGMAGKSMKLGDYWTNQGIPERARVNWPLVRDSEGSIVWVAGLQISERYRITDQTSDVLKMKLEYRPGEY